MSSWVMIPSCLSLNVSALIFPTHLLSWRTKQRARAVASKFDVSVWKASESVEAYLSPFQSPRIWKLMENRDRLENKHIYKRREIITPTPLQFGFILYSVNFPPLKESSSSHGINASIFHWCGKKGSGFAWVGNLSEELMTFSAFELGEWGDGVVHSWSPALWFLTRYWHGSDLSSHNPPCHLLPIYFSWFT